MKRKNGFTLIELLAVIVILAIIALIAVPIIMNVIHEAKKGAAKDSMYGYVEAVELEVAKKMLSNTTSFALELNLTTQDGNLYQGDTKVLDVNFKGTTPNDGGTMTLTGGRVTNAVLNFGGYEVNYDGNIATVKGESKPTTPSTPTPDLSTYEIGDQVQVKGLTGTFHVIKQVVESDTMALLFYDNGVASGVFATTKSAEFSGSLAEQLLKENTATWKTSIEGAGGNTSGIVISIPSKEELVAIRSFYGFTNDLDSDNIGWLQISKGFYTKTINNPDVTPPTIFVYRTDWIDGNAGVTFNYGYDIRPTLIINKSNLTKVS